MKHSLKSQMSDKDITVTGSIQSCPESHNDAVNKRFKDYKKVSINAITL